tara:strand:- start:211 stop:822 length:612 start_codon:yes stop_codon:yes gene_type:complete
MQLEQGSLEIKTIKENPANPNQYVGTVALPGFSDESAYFDKKDFVDMPQPGFYVVQYRRVGAKKSIKVESWELSSTQQSQPSAQQQPMQQPMQPQPAQQQPQQPEIQPLPVQPQPKYISAKDVIIYMESTMTDVTNGTNVLFPKPVVEYLMNDFITNVKNADPKDFINYFQDLYLSSYEKNLKSMSRVGIDRYWELRNEQEMS